ncbi:hypothetical protein ROZALSC1DRAFT_30741 [Rozella allomycis CSF55]|uniref:RNA polymerase II assembly factor Rtp1 C-terminal domain-containing protein n=1 Tax=Rozella allomycis (strain CSF55) TaxID=988480 RepID=A0A4V1IZB2_ROZAC|nr:hypothetical protein ROZALSC1DRAFT_30741 [Rozella allomycis CSF55]
MLQLQSNIFLRNFVIENLVIPLTVMAIHSYAIMKEIFSLLIRDNELEMMSIFFLNYIRNPIALDGFKLGPEGGLCLEPCRESQEAININETFFTFLKELSSEELIISVTSKMVMELLESPGNDLLDLVIRLVDDFGENFLKYPNYLLNLSISILDIKCETESEAIKATVLELCTIMFSDPESVKDLEQNSVILLKEKLESNLTDSDAKNLHKLISIYFLSYNNFINEKKSKEEEAFFSELKQCMKQLNSEQVPARAAALYKLKLLIRKHKFLIKEEILLQCFDTFLHHLKDEDSFVYLNAVKCLSTLTDLFPDKIIPKIFTEYASKFENVEISEDIYTGDDEYQIRLGESLLQTIQRLGSAVDCYVTMILPTLLRLIDRQRSSRLVSSALSLLSSISEASPFSLRFEIFNISKFCVDCIKMETNIDIRRASLCLLKFILNGFGDDIYNFLNNEFVQEIHEIIIRIKEDPFEEDSIAKYHAIQAAEFIPADPIVSPKKPLITIIKED